MRRGIGWVAVGVLVALPAQGTGPQTVYVDCEAAQAGSGSWSAPYDSITAALPRAAELAELGPVEIAVDEGVCDGEEFPIVLDFPVHVRGVRKPRFDWQGFPLGTQSRDTVVSAPALEGGTPMFLLLGDGVRLSGLSLDGNVDPGPDLPPPPVPAPIGVIAGGTFRIESLRIFETSVAVRVEGGSGVVVNNHIDRTNTGIGVLGDELPNRVVVMNNRVGYRLNGIAAGGGAPDGTPAWATEVLFVRNDIVTTFTNTGPTNPAAFRPSPFLAPLKAGELRAIFFANRIRGAPKFAFILHEINAARGQGPYTGAMEVSIFGNEIDATAQAAPSIITFTNSFGVVAPCQLTPPGHPGCPPGPKVEYLEGASYDVWHDGALDGAWIDHPETDPGDGRVLDNLLVINGEIIDNQTFVVIP